MIFCVVATNYHVRDTHDMAVEIAKGQTLAITVCLKFIIMQLSFCLLILNQEEITKINRHKND